MRVKDTTRVGRTDTESKEKCAHAPCNCTVQTPGGYCSESCRSASDAGETRCRCGHPACG